MEVLSMEEARTHEVVVDSEESTDRPEIVIEAIEADVVFEDIPDEDELPPGWEDLIYEQWREQQSQSKAKFKSNNNTLTK